MLTGEKILVTGAAGQVAFPIAQELAKSNEVYGMSRFGNPADREKLEALGIKCIRKNIGSDSLDDVPDDFTYVFHAGATTTCESEQDWQYTFDVNAHGTGRLMYHCRNVKGFLHCSTSSIYQ